ncbi:MAG: S8 family serine peptidase [bacterium]|nr:S8 family serine peptidase [bacterium]
MIRYKNALFLLLLTLLVSPALVLAQSDVEKQLLVRWKGDGEIETINIDDPEVEISAYQINPLVDHVEQNVTRTLAVFPNDPSSGDQYYLKQDSDVDIDAGRAWNVTTGSNNVVIAVIDTGVDLDHPDLSGNIWVNTDEIANNGIDDDGNGYIDDVNGWDFVENDNDPNPTPTSFNYFSTVVVHGTHVAGIIGALGNNTLGVAGINWDVSIMPLRVFDDTGNSSTTDIVNAIEYAHANGARVLNMSYGGSSASVYELEAIRDAYDDGVISMAAAGNEGVNLNKYQLYPACYGLVLSVSATDNYDNRASFSNYGTDCVDVAAPGESILSTYYQNVGYGFLSYYGYLSGTSMSTPIVAGIAGLLLAVDDNLSVFTMRNLIIDSADNISDDTLGSGRVNAYQALLAEEELDAPDAPVITAYHNSKKKKQIGKKTRTKDSHPYFTWKEPDSSSSIVGYYVYFGNRKKNPKKYGTLRTKRNYYPAGVRGNEKNYRLRIKAVDENNKLSKIATFKYISDTKVKRPTWDRITKNDAGLELRWYQEAGEYVMGYHIYRAVDGDKKFSKITSSRVMTKSFIDTTVEPGHIYKYKVRSIDDLGNESKLSKSKKYCL